MEISTLIVDADGLLLTGKAASTTLKIRRVIDGYLLDWSDLTFKAAGWGTIATPLVEVDATNLAGLYKKDVVITEWNDGYYQTIIRMDDAVTVLNFSDTFYVADGIQALGDTRLDRILGLAGENMVMDQTVFDANNKMISARVRIYDSAANATAAGATGLIATFPLTMTWAARLLSTMKQVMS